VSRDAFTATEVRKLLLDLGAELGAGEYLLRRAQVMEPRLAQVRALKRVPEFDEVLQPGPARARDTDRSPPPDDEPTEPAA
jgi:hypothetical protein